ncbi:MAG: HEAT repeat domain-containing protein [Phycisphaerales bacterium]|nr:HEAT repeat domain-containing protein [Phycisphaerales bacterium]
MAHVSTSRAVLITMVAGMGMALCGPAVPMASAQPTQSVQTMSPDQLVRDYVHFVLIARPDLASSVATEILRRNIAGAEFVDLVEESTEDLERFQAAVIAHGRMEGGRETSEALWALYNQGKLDRSRNADQIAEAIQMLLGDARARLLARERLVAAGEYAMTQMVEVLVSRTNDRLRAEVARLMVDMGQQAVMPLCTLLPGAEPVVQEQVADLLGLIGYRTAIPYLYDTSARTQVAAVRQACSRALERLGRSPGGANVANEYLILAERFYDEQREVTSFPGEQTQLLWSFSPETGLRSTGINTAVYHEAVAMGLAERALQLDQANASATSMWVAANLSREIDTPQGYRNPAYAANRRGADFYAISAGTNISMRVLLRAIDDRDTPLSLRAIASAAKTAGPAALAGSVELGQIGDGQRRPLVEALTYPNRRVRYESALAFGIAQPRQTFPGVERVVPTLAAAVRDPGAQYAVVVSPDSERYNSIRRILEAQGFQVLPSVQRIGDAQSEINAVPGIDVIVVNLTSDTTREQIDEIRRNDRLAATPVVALVSGEGYTTLGRIYERDTSTAIRPLGSGEGEIRNTIAGLVERTSGGPFSSQEAQAYRDRALDVMLNLAISGNAVLSVSDASETLIASLESSNPIIRLRVAEILSYVNNERVQIALADMAMNANLSEGERVEILGRVAASAKRFGNRLESRQVTRLVALARSTQASEQEASAASALLGALDAQSQGVVPLILGN